jgi:hypothetical protein
VSPLLSRNATLAEGEFGQSWWAHRKTSPAREMQEKDPDVPLHRRTSQRGGRGEPIGESSDYDEQWHSDSDEHRDRVDRKSLLLPFDRLVHDRTCHRRCWWIQRWIAAVNAAG